MVTADTSKSRRSFLSFLTSMLLAFLGLLVAIPALGYIFGPLRGRSGTGPNFMDAGPLADIPIGEWRLLPVEMVQEDGWRKTRVRQAIWVRRQGEEAAQGITIFSSICPHLGCPINWHPDQGRFFCPCHGGIFDPSGRHTGGPPPRSMDSLEFEVRAGRLWVRWQDFKIGVAKRVPVNI